VAGRVEMPGSVAMRRGIAATHVATGPAQPQVNPTRTDLEALFAALCAGHHIADRAEVRTLVTHRSSPLICFNKRDQIQFLRQASCGLSTESGPVRRDVLSGLYIASRRGRSYCFEGACATTRIPKLPGLIVGRGCGSALVGAGRGPSSAAERYTRPVASSSAMVRALFWVGTLAIT